VAPSAHTYITANLQDLGLRALGDLSVGIGLTVPFWLADSLANTARSDRPRPSSTLPLLDIKPTLPTRLRRMFSLGLGADIYTFTGTRGRRSCRETVDSLPPG